jgi:hypothetical protein
MFFSLFDYSFALSYGNYSYQPSFYEKLKNMAFWVVQHYNNGFYSDALVPFRVKVGYTWDTIAIYFKGSNLSGNVFTSHGSYDYSDVCANYQKYTFTWDATFFGGLGPFDGDNTSYCIAGRWVETYQGSGITWEYYLSGWKLNPALRSSYYPCGTFVYSISGAGSVPASSHRVYCSIDNYVSTEKTYMEVNPVPSSVSPSAPVLTPAIDNVLNNSGSFDVNNAIQNNQYNIADLQSYVQSGYIDGSNDVVGSTSPYTINNDSNVVSGSTNSVSGSSVSVNSIDLSTTNKLLSDIYNFMRSTYVDTSDLDAFSNSLNQSTGVVHSIFSHFLNFFHTTSNDVWDCSIDFQSWDILGFKIDIGKFNLCEKWGWVFDLLKKMLNFSALVMAFYIVGGV